MLSKIPVVVAVAALTLAGNHFTGTGTGNPGAGACSNSAARYGSPVSDGGRGGVPRDDSYQLSGVSGSVLSWNGLGSADALLGPSVLARVGIALEGDDGLRILACDGNGHFDQADLVPGRYVLKVLWDGQVAASRTLCLEALEGAAVEIRLLEDKGGVRVSVRSVGDGPLGGKGLAGASGEPEGTVGPAVSGEIPMSDDFLDDLAFERDDGSETHPPFSGEPVVEGLGGIHPDDEAWMEKPASTLLELLDNHMFIDPDVNVSQVGSGCHVLPGDEIRAL